MTKGFIVYPSYKTEEDKAIIQLYGRLDNGKSFLIENDYKAYFYIKTKDKSKAKALAPVKYIESSNTNFEGEKVTKVELETPKLVPEIRKLFSDNNIPSYEADIKFAMRYLIDQGIKNSLKIEGKPVKEKGVDCFYKNASIKPAEFFPKLKVLSFDIETDRKAKEIYSIALFGDGVKEVLLVKPSEVKNAKTFPNEKLLLEHFIKRIKEIDPDIITGWNVIDFDLRVLKEKARKYKLTFSLGRDDSESRIYHRESFFAESKAICPGRMVLDVISLLKSSFIKLDNYKLETAAKEFVGKGKIFTGPDRYKHIDEAYKKDIQTFIGYNLLDAKLAYEIIHKSNVLDLTITRSLITGIQLDGVRGSISSLDSLYLRELKKKKLVAPTSNYNEREERIKGGFVRESKPGIYENILILDFKSLYPSIIRTFNIDPYSYVKDPSKFKKNDLIKAPNNAFFQKKEGILPLLIQDLWDHRDQAKKKKNELESYAIKILMNSFFGVLANPICRFYSVDLGNAITYFGQELIKLCADKVEEHGYEVIYGDTDSIFVNPNEKDTKKATNIGKELQTFVNSFFVTHIKKTFNTRSYLQIEFEKVFTKFFMPKLRHAAKGAKKRYAGLVENKGKEELVFTGLEFVRSDWTNIAKEFQEKLLLKLFKGEKIEKFIVDFVKEMKDGNHDDLLIYRKSIRKPVEEYVKTTPPHIKAARKIGRKGVGLIEYIITVNGPEPIEAKKSRMDYDHYIEKQIKPIADSILVFFDKEFEDILNKGKQSSLGDF